METLIYFGKVNICWILFFSCYWLFFSQHTFFRGNRLYLLVTLLLSFVIPAISFPETEVPALPQVTYIMASTPEIIITAQPAPETSFPWIPCLLMVYVAGVSFMVYRFFNGITKLSRIIENNEKYDFDDYTLVLLSKTQSFTGSFSFFRWLIVSHQDYNHNLDTILCHERVHIRQCHSLDIILIELLKIAFWFNPILWLYKKSLQEIHEYLADEQAPNKERYTTFLVSYALNAPIQSLTNHFFNRSLLKSRVKMIYKNRTSRWLLGKYLVIVPVLLLVIGLTAARERLHLPSQVSALPEPASTDNPTPFQDLIPATVVNKTPVNSDETITVKGRIKDQKGFSLSKVTVVVKNTHLGTSSSYNGSFELKNVPVNSTLVISHVSFRSIELPVDKMKTDYAITLEPVENILKELVVVGYGTSARKYSPEETKDSDQVNDNFQIVEKKAEFPGGEDEMMRYLAKNIRYPSEASRVNMTGTIIISFVVNQYGVVRKPTVIKGLGFGLDDEATRVVSNMPKWNPAIQNNEAVSSEYIIPIKFQIEADPKDQENKQGYRSPTQPITSPSENNVQKAAEAQYVNYTSNYSLGTSSTMANYKFLKFTTQNEVNYALGTSTHVPSTFTNYKIAKPVVRYRYQKTE